MAQPVTTINLDARKLAGHITFTVKVRKTLWIKFGLLFIRLGCWITGARFVDESEE